MPSTPDSPPPVDHLEVPARELRWRCDPNALPFQSTAEVEPVRGVVGQDDALEALRFGLEVAAPGQNVFVRGLTGTGRSTLVRHLLGDMQPACPVVPDLCYVHNFEEPNRPRLLQVPRGRGAAFRDRVDELADFIRDKLAPSLSSDAIRKRQAALDNALAAEVKEIGAAFEEELRNNQLTLVTLQLGPQMQPAIFPIIDGQPVPPDDLPQLIEGGKITNEDAEQIRQKVSEFSGRLPELSRQMREAQEQHRNRVRKLYEGETRRILQYSVDAIAEDFPSDHIRVFLDGIIEDVVRLRLQEGNAEDTTRRYRPNLILEHKAAADAANGCPVIVENTPTLRNLLGVIDRKVAAQGVVYSDHLMISAGSLLRSNGGYLILEARDVMTEPGAWKVLVRTLRTGKLEIVPQESFWLGTGSHMQPEPIDVQIKVILLGDPDLYHALDGLDPDFPNLFKVLADFDSTIPRNAEGIQYYAGVLARIAHDENLPPFDRGAVTALAEHGARIAARRDRLTSRFGRLADIAREAAFLANKSAQEIVTADQVQEAVRRTKRRADLPSRKFRELIREGTIRIQTQGTEVGQINGLAVTRSGQLSYGFPTRITATIGAGSSGAINIEREARLSGAIHTKGFYILGGLLRRLLRTRHPLAFSASIAFEQSYGGIDGDSASGAEMCCLLSALTGVPLRQDVAMTGAIDQFGAIQSVGSVTEKIEGFYDTCRDLGPADTQGVIVPKGNLGDLMLRQDVVEACEAGRFHVYGVDSIHDALEILTGRAAGHHGDNGAYPEDSVLGLAVHKALEYWHLATARPELPAPPAVDEVEDEAEGKAAAEQDEA